MDGLTFGLAVVAYGMLCADVALHAARRPWRPWTAALAAVVTGHVALVWLWRFGGSFQAAWGKGAAPFVIFHAAYAAIVAAAFAREPWSGRLLWGAFPVATAGVFGAAFRYDYVAWTRVPVALAFAVTALVLVRVWRRR